MQSGTWLRFISQRLLKAIPVLLLVALGVFTLLELAEGDAVDAYLVESGAADSGFVEALRERYGIADSLGARLLAYLTHLITLDLGESIAFSRPVTAVILERLPNTLLLMGPALLLSASVGTVLGGIAALRRGGPIDFGITAVALVLNATPGFWLGLLGVILFAVKLRWLPIAGIATLDAGLGPVAATLDVARHLLLPVVTLALIYLALYVRVMRAAMIESIASGWVLAARARGLGTRRIALRYMARPALLPVITLLGLQAGAMLGGSVVIETVFAIPGLGSLAYAAVTQRDLLLLAGILLVGTLLVVCMNLAADVFYRLFDPRVIVGRDTR